MAITPRRAMSTTFGFRDQENTESNMLVHMTNPLFAGIAFAGFVEYLTFAKVDLANVVAQLSECDLSYIGIRMRETNDAQTPFGTGEAEKKGVLLFLDESGAPSFRMAIPGIKESQLAANGRDIDTAATEIAALIAEFATGTAAQPITPNGFHIETVQSAYKQHRVSHTGRARRTG